MMTIMQSKLMKSNREALKKDKVTEGIQSNTSEYVSGKIFTRAGNATY